jgi:hypothetical protein
MTHQKYFKFQYFFQLLITIGRPAITISCALMFIFFAVINSAFALDWNDKEWVDCTSKVNGVWVSDEQDSINRKTLNIEENRVRLTQGKDSEVSFNGLTFEEKGNFLEMVLHSTTKDKEIHLKLRPHMVQTTVDPENITDCSIKVFQFNSQTHAKFDKYSSWSIYQLKHN